MKYESNSCENAVKEDLEDGEIFDEDDDTEMGKPTDQNTESKLSKDICFGKGSIDDDFELQWDMEQQSHKKILLGVSSTSFAGFNNSRPKGVFPTNKGAIMKRDVGYLMDDNRPSKRQRFDQVVEKYSMLRNNQNEIFNRKTNETLMNSVEGANNEDMLYAGGSYPDISNFETFPRKFAEDFRPAINNFGRRESRVGGDMDHCNRGIYGKRQMEVGPIMKNKRRKDENKFCQYFFQGKCFKDKFEEEPKPVVEKNFNSKIYKTKIPSLLEMIIPVPPQLKITKADSESNSYTNNNNTPMPSLSREKFSVDYTCKIDDTKQPDVPQNNRLGNKSKIHHKKNKEKQMRKKELKRLKRYEEKILETRRQQNENLTINTNDFSLFDDLSDDEKFNDLVIDEEKCNDDVDEQ